MKKMFVVLSMFMLLNIGIVFAHEHNLEEAKELIDSKVSCDELGDEQLELIGEYYMEQMHPGEAHEVMDEMMGGEDSESLRQMHIQMAKVLYCGESGGMMGSGMMGMMPMMRNMMMGGGSMMGSGMMGNNPVGFGYGYWSFWNLVWSLFWIGIIVLIIWLIYKFIIKKEAVSETPINILKKRFAKGELTKKQFEDMKKEIR